MSREPLYRRLAVLDERGKSHPHRNWIPGLPAHKSLYRLSYPGLSTAYRNVSSDYSDYTWVWLLAWLYWCSRDYVYCISTATIHLCGVLPRRNEIVTYDREVNCRRFDTITLTICNTEIVFHIAVLGWSEEGRWDARTRIEGREMYGVLLGEREGQGPFGRHGRGWEDNVTIGLQ